jgi:hypothetical protein
MQIFKELECIFNQFLKYHTNIFLDLNAKVGMEDIFRTTGNGNLHEINNDNGVRVANFPTSKNMSGV